MSSLRLTKKSLLLPVLFLAALGAVYRVRAESSVEALAHVYVDVVPNIDIQSIAQQASDIPNISGQQRFSVVSRFLIAANSDRLEMGCVASDLYAAAVPSSTNRIRLNAAMGCVIEVSEATPLGGRSPRAMYHTDTPVEIAGFQAFASNFIPFESFQAGQFSMQVGLRVHYELPRQNFPQGQYGGVVKLVALTYR